MNTGLLAPHAVTVIKGLSLLTDYLTNYNTFPHPLSESEEAQYLARLQQGDDEARPVLIERILRLIARLAKRTESKKSRPGGGFPIPQTP